MRVPLGPISHFDFVVRDPSKSAEWWQAHFEVDKLFEFEDGVCIANSQLMMVLRRGVPAPIGHTAFKVADEAALEAALAILREHDVELEDPGSEIGPVAEGSESIGLWFRDPDGYRWELFLQR